MGDLGSFFGGKMFSWFLAMVGRSIWTFFYRLEGTTVCVVGKGMCGWMGLVGHLIVWCRVGLGVFNRTSPPTNI